MSDCLLAAPNILSMSLPFTLLHLPLTNHPINGLFSPTTFDTVLHSDGTHALVNQLMIEVAWSEYACWTVKQRH